MKRILELNNNVISEDDKSTILEIFPNFEPQSFKENNNGFEYDYFPNDVVITLDSLEKLTEEFNILLTEKSLIIQL